MTFYLPNWNVICRGVVLLTLVCLMVVYQMGVDTEKIQKIPDTVYLLLWTSPTVEPLSSLGKGIETFVKRKCPVMNCYVTSRRDFQGDVTHFDAVIFHGKEIVNDKKIEMPKKRDPHQIYVFASMESAGYYPVPEGKYDNYFNLTWTYKLNSDIYYGYFTIRNRNGEIIGPSEEMNWIKPDQMLPASDIIKEKIANKRKTAAWFVSNCRTPSKRQNVVEDIQREMNDYGLAVDVYGKCGDKKCPRSSENECFKLIETEYYFYFAFENSFGEDYVTEKLLHALNNYAVPVVFGGANYSRFMPDGAYLDAFKLGPKELVQQMFEIINDPDRYISFFKWHNHYSYHDIEKSPDTDPYCKFCDHINIMKSRNKSKVIHNFGEWWNPQIAQWVHFYK